MKKKLGIGIVGSGSILETHINSIQNMPDAELAAIFTRSRENGEKISGQYNIPYYNDYQDFLHDHHIDIVTIITPSGTHSDFGILAAKKGKHVIVEKPIEINLAKTDELIRVCKESNVKLSCIFQHRFDDGINDIKLALSKGLFGQLNFGAARTTWYRSQEYYDSGAWRGTWELDGGGALMNQSIHYIDLLLYLMGPVEEVFGYCATRGHERIEVEDISVASLKFKSGALGLIEGNTAAYPGYSASLEIFGNNGSVVIKNDQVEEWNFRDGKTYTKAKNEGIASSPSTNKITNYQSHKRQYHDIINAIINVREPLVTGEEARNSLELVLAIYESAKIGKPVKL
ncbi:gfo/Idh/MocA family oxidoreductase [Lysinibacillus yapensis]|uniref:Gfo/Idh/MocA family oxidoreductase n=1 Tax=Ureibacillus yapensis TaxID=2304605 RepID=A0A396S938_9BACL|nr:Gfo/Idh/MocA family oxidoreductase [Lysinibacillus yapensis]RHW37619.1 gfo/Idh/MocA family oxidoreductase [Lysinibacillus yapensis]